jgi:putative PIN family toxin of toxin-antitoxin system
MTHRVVFDCMVFLQALARPAGPAGRCLSAAANETCELVISDEVLAEVQEVVSRPAIRRAFIRATDEDVTAFFHRLAGIMTRIDSVPPVVALTRDPKDEKYLNLAVAAGAAFVVSRDNDLLDLMTGTGADAVAFRTAYPGIAILDPVAFLRTLPLGDSSRTRPDEAP